MFIVSSKYLKCTVCGSPISSNQVKDAGEASEIGKASGKEDSKNGYVTGFCPYCDRTVCAERNGGIDSRNHTGHA